MRLYVLLLLVTIGFTSCKKEEDKIEDKKVEKKED